MNLKSLPLSELGGSSRPCSTDCLYSLQVWSINPLSPPHSEHRHQPHFAPRFCSYLLITNPTISFRLVKGSLHTAPSQPSLSLFCSLQVLPSSCLSYSLFSYSDFVNFSSHTPQSYFAFISFVFIFPCFFLPPPSPILAFSLLSNYFIRSYCLFIYKLCI
jgi:hypothetical protein